MYIYICIYINIDIDIDPYPSAIFVFLGQAKQILYKKIQYCLLLKLGNQCILSLAIKLIPLPELTQRCSLCSAFISNWFNFRMVENSNRIHLIKRIYFL